jgi:hypothetical protein
MRTYRDGCRLNRKRKIIGSTYQRNKEQQKLNMPTKNVDWVVKPVEILASMSLNKKEEAKAEEEEAAEEEDDCDENDKDDYY